MGEALPELAATPTTGPKAAMDQFDVQAWEAGLLTVARVQHPNVSWWHGYRHLESGWVSQCYVCDQPIAAWAGGGSPPIDARQLIAAHRQSHHDGTVPAVTNPLEGESA